MIEPCLPSPVKEAPSGEEWVHELKLDGYRMVAYLERGKVTIRSRRGNDWTRRFPGIARALSRIPGNVILDGEVVSLDARGRSSFELLQQETQEPVFFAFDCLWDGRHDLRGLPMLERKERASERLRGRFGRVRYLSHITGNGPVVEAQARRLGVEGVVSKKGESHYVPGRSDTWVKTKFWHEQDVIVGGWLPSENSREAVGALVCGEMVDEELHYLCTVRSGFSDRQKASLFRQMRERKTPAFVVPPSGYRWKGIRWCRPQLVASVRYLHRTGTGRLRMTTFRGLRED